MARRDRSFSPESSNKRVRQSYRSPRSPSPTRRSTQKALPRSRYEDRDRNRDRERDRDRDRDRHRDDRYRDDRRRDSHRDDRRRSRSGDRRPASPSRPLATNEPVQTPPPEDEKLKAKRAKLEAWKKEREAKKALDEAKAKAMALAGKSVPGE